MRAAPPVQVAVDWRLGAAWVAVLAGLAAAGFAAWVFGHAQWPVAAPGAAAAAAAAGMVSWRGRRTTGERLAWDGRAWHWGQHCGGVRLMIDADAWMLLRFDPASAARPHWLLVSAGACGGGWHGLRAAVYSRASTPPR
jgi:hypothetical protein